MTHIRTPGKAYDSAGRHTGPGPWLDVIHEANRVAPGMFGGAKSTGDWWAGGFSEEYEDARVIHRPDGSVSVVSKTARGAEVLASAAGALGISVEDNRGWLSGEFAGSSCDPETCDLDEACPFFDNCYSIWREHAESWERTAMRQRSAVPTQE